MQLVFLCMPLDGGVLLHSQLMGELTENEYLVKLYDKI